ncbi:MAG: PQQ-binding-like beta-propeller repeat protein, partial [Planctomycetota bacterium]|nr:PQQ-binding-like beta-propeller repeat protein [Planctomycetota bacterium]
MTRDLCRGAAWFVGAALLFVRPEATLRAADWPMWRHDAARGAASDEELAEELHLQWVLELSTPRPAWPSSQEKLQFDTHYEPVLAGGKLFVPSMVADRVTAHDSRTGEELWRFYADGPVRFAPLHWRGKVYFVSDDSYLYCLDARDGSLLWKFRGGPSESKVLGNERLISSWPARGAPVLFDGTIYFAASIWPFMGVFVQALNAETGEVVWTNSGSGSTYLVQQHNDPAFAGVAPQGYMAATEDHLVVSGGRTMPAIFDRKTGEFLHFDVGSRAMGSKGGGGYAVIAGENFYLNQGPKNQGAMYRFDTGKFVTSVGAAVLSKYALIGLSERFGRQTVRGYRPGWRLTEFTDRRGKKQKRAVAISSWSATLEERVEQLFIKSGPRLYCRGPKNSVVAVDLPSLDRGARISWRTRLPDRPLAMISGDGRLFVSTDLGRIYCFGAEDRDVDLPTGETGVLVPRGSSWKFADDGTDLGTSWRQPSYDDSEWSVGPAQLGYGDGDEATRLSFGGDPKKKPVTVYFRRAFQVAEGSRFTELKLSTLVDDGGVVYLNGQEVARHFLPEGEIGSDTLAESGTDEKTYESVTLPGDALRTGENTLAVEVHQRRRDSSDLSFDLELSGELAGRRSQLPVVEDRWTEVARAILQEKGLREKGLAGDGKGRDGGARDGYCLALGLGSGRLVEELARLSRLHVVVVERDAAKIDAFRRRIDDAGVYGVRIAAIAGDPRSLELPPYAVDLLVSEEPRAAGFGEGESFARRAFKLLRPYSGLAVFAASREEQRDFEVAVRRARLDGGSARRSGRFALLERTAPPSGSGDWTHQYADSSNSVVSKDSVVRAPLGLLWFGGPPNDQVLPRHGHGPTPQVCRGRLFIEGRHMMRALDIYTGRLLWQRELKDLGKYYDYTGHEPGANAIGSNYVSLADGVYVVHGKKCLHLDPATGETLRELVLPAADDKAEPPEWGYIGAWGDYLLAGARPVDYSSPYLTAREIAGLKDPVIQEALKIMKTWKGFEPLERRQKEDDKSFLRANVNKLLAEEGFLERIPAEVRKKAKAEKDEDQLLDYLEDLPGRRPTDWVALAIKRQLLSRYYKLPGYKRQEPGTFGSERRVGSKQLIALKRQSGEPLWQFEGHHQFRHNAVAAGNGWVFCVDRLPDAVAERHRRRGVETSGESRLVALDLGTGEILWSTSRRVFGTWLGYSEEHDVLLQAGSKGRDRMRDEV